MPPLAILVSATGTLQHKSPCGPLQSNLGRSDLICDRLLATSRREARIERRGFMLFIAETFEEVLWAAVLLLGAGIRPRMSYQEVR